MNGQPAGQTMWLHIEVFEQFPFIFDMKDLFLQIHYQYQLLLDICLFNILFWAINSIPVATTTGLYPQHTMP